MSLRASFDGTPAPSVEWLKNGEPVSQSNANIKTTEYDTCLTLNGVCLSDEGEYSCKIVNSAGIDVTKCQIEIEKPKVVVKPKPVPVQEVKEVKEDKPVKKEVVKSFEQETPEQETQVVEAKPEPVVVVKPVSNENKFGFIKHIISQNLVEGDALVLESEIYGKEPLEVVWLRNGKEIPENPDFLKEKKDNFYRLIVSEIFPEDSGVFSVELFSEAANQSVLSSCSVVVRGKLSLTLISNKI